MRKIEKGVREGGSLETSLRSAFSFVTFSTTPLIKKAPTRIISAIAAIRAIDAC